MEGGGWVLGADDRADALADVGDEDEIGVENDDDEARKTRYGDGETADRETARAGTSVEEEVEVERVAVRVWRLHLINVMQNASELLCFSPSDVA